MKMKNVSFILWKKANWTFWPIQYIYVKGKLLKDKVPFKV